MDANLGFVRGRGVSGPPVGDFLLQGGLTVGLDVLGAAVIYAGDFIASPGSSSAFEVARLVGGPYSGFIALDCADAAASPIELFVRGSAPEVTAGDAVYLTVTDPFGACVGP